MEQCNISDITDKEVWNIFGYSVPKPEVVYFCQIFALYLVILVCLVNLCINDSQTELWSSLLSASIGYLLPNPSLKRQKIIFAENFYIR